MKHLSPLALAVLTLVTASHSAAKIQNFNYSNEMCDIKAQYDDSKHTAQQIKDTLKLTELYYMQNPEMESDYHSFSNPPSLKLLQALNQQYQYQRGQIINLKIVNLPKYQKLKQIKLEEYKNLYEMNALKLLAVRDPKKLLTDQYGKQCYQLAERMNLKGNQLINAARSTVLEFMANERKKGNSDQAWINSQLNNYNEGVKNARDPSDFAFKQIMFHWNNCVVDRFPDNETFLSKITPEKDLFVKYKSYCDF